MTHAAKYNRYSNNRLLATASYTWVLQLLLPNIGFGNSCCRHGLVVVCFVVIL
jgi:hypothetical protein